MDDILLCPVCGNKLRNIRTADKFLHPVNKTATYFERTCSGGMNHSLQLFTDEATKQVDLLKISLNSKFSRYVEIDFLNKKSRIHCLKDGKPQYIDIPKMVVPDFPTLTKLKERVGLYITFS